MFDNHTEKSPANKSSFSFRFIFLLMFLVFISSFPPISTDLYLPALPEMGKFFRADSTQMQFTLSGFMLSFAVSMLFWGNFSDKVGRKPILIIGSTIYMFASLGALFFSENLDKLIFWRCLQGVGSSALTTMAFAIVKDLFPRNQTEKILGLMQTFIVIAPILAPVLGGIMLLWMSWRGLFITLFIFGLIAFLASIFFVRETLRPSKRNKENVFKNLRRIPFVLSQKNFLFLLILFSLTAIPFMAYLSVSSYIYQNYFGKSPQEFSIFFSMNAMMSMLGLALYVKVWSKFVNRQKLISLVYKNLIILGSLLLVITFVDEVKNILFNEWTFTALVMLIIFNCATIRPPATFLMMSQLDSDNGTVSSLIGCFGFIFGAFGMYIANLDIFGNYVANYGSLATIIGILSSIIWFMLNKHNLYRKIEVNK